MAVGRPDDTHQRWGLLACLRPAPGSRNLPVAIVEGRGYHASVRLGCCSGPLDSTRRTRLIIAVPIDDEVRGNALSCARRVLPLSPSSRLSSPSSLRNPIGGQRWGT